MENPIGEWVTSADLCDFNVTPFLYKRFQLRNLTYKNTMDNHMKTNKTMPKQIINCGHDRKQYLFCRRTKIQDGYH